MGKVLYEIDNIEVFAAGTWNDEQYSFEDLDEMVRGFHENKEKIRPFLKLGHDNDQKLLQIDGMPAAGWVSNLVRVGDKLVATFSDMPKKIYELIQSKAYRKVSSEIYWNIELNGKFYKRFLSAVALLGSDMPAVTSLDSILGMFKAEGFEPIKSYAIDKKSITIKEYQFETEGEDFMSEKELKEKLDAALASIEQLVAKQEKFSTDLKSKDQEVTEKENELTELREYKVKKDQESKEQSEKLALAQMENDWNVLEKLGAPKSVKEFALALLGTQKKEYTINKEVHKQVDLIAKIVKLTLEASKVNFDESSIEGDKSKQADADSHKKIEEYAANNKCSYSEAYKVIKAGHKDVYDADDNDAEAS